MQYNKYNYCVLFTFTFKKIIYILRTNGGNLLVEYMGNFLYSNGNSISYISFYRALRYFAIYIMVQDERSRRGCVFTIYIMANKSNVFYEAENSFRSIRDRMYT